MPGTCPPSRSQMSMPSSSSWLPFELHGDVGLLPSGLEVEALDALAGHVGHEVEVAPGREDAALNAAKGERSPGAVAEGNGGDVGEGQCVAGPGHAVLADYAGAEGRRVEMTVDGIDRAPGGIGGVRQQGVGDVVEVGVEDADRRRRAFHRHVQGGRRSSRGRPGGCRAPSCRGMPTLMDQAPGTPRSRWTGIFHSLARLVMYQ